MNMSSPKRRVLPDLTVDQNPEYTPDKAFDDIDDSALDALSMKGKAFNPPTVEVEPVTCGSCRFFKQAGGFAKPCETLGIKPDRTYCPRYVTDFSQYPVKDRQNIVKAAAYMASLGVNVQHVIQTAVSSRNLRKRKFGETVTIPTSAAWAGGIDGTVIGETRGKLHIVMANGGLATVSDTNLNEVKPRALTVVIDGEDTKPTKLELVKAGKGKRKTTLTNSKQAGAISVRGDEDAPAKPPKVAKGKSTLIKALEVIARQKPKGKSPMDKALAGAAKRMAAEITKEEDAKIMTGLRKTFKLKSSKAVAKSMATENAKDKVRETIKSKIKAPKKKG